MVGLLCEATTGARVVTGLELFVNELILVVAWLSLALEEATEMSSGGNVMP